jgi:hypothetical protein
MKTIGNFTFWFGEQEFSEENFYKTIEGRTVELYIDNLKVVAKDAR